MAPFVGRDRDPARPAARVPGAHRRARLLSAQDGVSPGHLPPGRARAVHRARRLHPGHRQPHLHGRRQQRAGLRRRAPPSTPRSIHCGLHVRARCRSRSASSSSGALRPGVHRQGRDAAHPRYTTPGAQETLDRVMEFGGPGLARAVAWTSARRWPTWPPSAARAAGHLRGRRRDRCDWIAARRPGADVDALRGALRRARRGRASTTAACTRSTSRAIEPMVADARRPGPRHPLRPDQRRARRRARRGARSTSPTAAPAPPARRTTSTCTPPCCGRPSTRGRARGGRACASSSSSAREAVERYARGAGLPRASSSATGVRGDRARAAAPASAAGPGVSETRRAGDGLARSTATSRAAAGPGRLYLASPLTVAASAVEPDASSAWNPRACSRTSALSPRYGSPLPRPARGEA